MFNQCVLHVNTASFLLDPGLVHNAPHRLRFDRETLIMVGYYRIRRRRRQHHHWVDNIVRVYKIAYGCNCKDLIPQDYLLAGSGHIHRSIRDRLILRIHKYDVLHDQAFPSWMYLQSSDPRAYWQALEQRRKQFKVNSQRGDYFRTLFNPAVVDWPDASWTRAVLDTKTVSSSSYSRSTQWSAGLSGGWGLWSFGGSGGHSETYQHDHSEVTDLAADLEYLCVKIVRPWLLTDVFTYKFWTWSKTHGFVYISDGGNLLANPPVRPIGVGGMPFYPEKMVIVRKVKLTAQFTQTDNSVITSH